jgi:DNA end-binding protein Ku
MRSIWKGAIGFGLVNIPVRLYTAVSSHRIRFNQLHDTCGHRIRYKKWCPVCDREVPQTDIVKGYEYAKDRYVVLEKEDFEELPISTNKLVEILDFVNLEEIDPVYFDSSYYLEPDKGGEKAYRLLLEAMKSKERIAIAKVTLRSKESLAAVRCYSDRVLVMETMYYPNEVRATDELVNTLSDPVVQERELQLAVDIIDNLSIEFDPDRYRDEYRAALEEVIESKLEGREVTHAPERAKAPVVDLLEALERSLEETETAAAQSQTQA